MKIPGYIVGQRIAKGGMSNIYSALQRSLRRRVVIKVNRMTEDPKNAVRFIYEGRLLASIQHRNVITVYDVGDVDNRHYLSMEFLRGGSLAHRMKSPLTLEQTLDILEPIARCLDFVHEKSIIHRDIKPSNILFHEDGTPKLIDFGIAKSLKRDKKLTLSGDTLGSPHYLSPEQAEGRDVDGRSDIYSLGVIFFEMLTGHKPYDGNNHIDTIVKHLTNPVPLLPEELSVFQPLVDHMLAKDPDHRFSTAGEVADLMLGVRKWIVNGKIQPSMISNLPPDSEMKSDHRESNSWVDAIKEWNKMPIIRGNFGSAA